MSLWGCILSCSDDGGNESDTETPATTSGMSSSSTGVTNASGTGAETDDPSSSSSGADTDGGDDEGGSDPPPSGEAAGGITLTDLYIYQGVEIALVRDGQAVPIPSRNAPVIGQRPALFRAMWTLDDSFQNRMLEGILVIEKSNGELAVFREEKMISGPSNKNTMTGAFKWEVPAEDLDGLGTYYVLAEETGGATTMGTLAAPRIPATDSLPLDGWTERMLLDIVVVPTCGRPTLTKDEEDQMRSFLFNTYPINEINLEFRSSISGACGTSEATYTTMANLRQSDGAPPWRYYGALISGNCGGLAATTSTDIDANRSFSLCDWRDHGPTFDLYAHEAGHITGQAHTFENGSYPYASDGEIGSWGWGPIPGEMPSSVFSNDISIGIAWTDMQTLIPPTNSCSANECWRDFMSYSYPYYVSDYTYREMAEVIRSYAGWFGRPASDDWQRGRILSGVIGEDGAFHWGVRNGGAKSLRRLESSGRRAAKPAEFYRGDSLVAQRPLYIESAHLDPPPRDVPGLPIPLEVYTIPLPEGLEGDHFELELKGERYRFSSEQLPR